jgi:hypothetical protein
VKGAHDLPGKRHVDAVVEAVEEDGLRAAPCDGGVRVAQRAGLGVGALLFADELHIEAVLQAQHVRHADGGGFRGKNDVLAGVVLEALSDKAAEGCQHARELGVVDVEVDHPQVVVLGHTRELVQQALGANGKRKLRGRGGGSMGHGVTMLLPTVGDDC